MRAMTTTGQGKWALVTGASAGIGEAFSRRLARDGWNLALVARRRDKLESLAAELTGAHGIRTVVVVQDLREALAAQAVFEATEGQDLEIDLLINNAGFGWYGRFPQMDATHVASMIDLNCRTLVGLSVRHGEKMRQRGHGGILHLASVLAFHPVPYLAVYGATKAFVLSFSEALWAELRPSGVTVTALCPGFTATEFSAVSGLRVDGHRVDRPEHSVELGLAALAAGKSHVIPGWINYALACALPRCLPRSWAARVAELTFNYW